MIRLQIKCLSLHGLVIVDQLRADLSLGAVVSDDGLVITVIVLRGFRPIGIAARGHLKLSNVLENVDRAIFDGGDPGRAGLLVRNDRGNRATMARDCRQDERALAVLE